jgi:hypothetical protein
MVARHRAISILRGCAVLAVFVSAFPLRAQDTAEKILIGDTKVTMLRSYDGKDKLHKPVVVEVYDFTVSPDAVTIDRSPVAHILDNDPIARRRGTAGQNSDPTEVAARVQAAFTQQLIKELSKTAIPVLSASSSAGGDSAVYALNVEGDFTAVKQGDMEKRMMIGFGRGASDVQSHVIVSLTLASGPILLAEFNLSSESGKKPGAVATMGVGSAAASVAVSGATDSKATVEGDAARMAKVVATEVENIMAAQKWIAPPEQAKQPQTAQTNP